MGIDVKVLVVDDDRVSRVATVKLVEKLGLVAVQAENGATALDVIEANPDLSLMITDIMMPKLGGREMVQVVRGKNDYLKFPVILTSGVIGPDAVSDLLSSEFTCFIAKPIAFEALKEAIGSMVGKSAFENSGSGSNG